MDPMHKVSLWPQVHDELLAHALSLTIGRYFGTPCLLSRWGLEDYLCFLAVMIEVETKKLVKSYGEPFPEIPPTVEGPVLAEVLIRNWKSTPELRERFTSFGSYVDSVEGAIERGLSVDFIEPLIKTKERS